MCVYITKTLVGNQCAVQTNGVNEPFYYTLLPTNGRGKAVLVLHQTGAPMSNLTRNAAGVILSVERPLVHICGETCG